MNSVTFPALNATRILLAECDIAVADRLKAALVGADFNVQIAYNFGDAIAADHSRFNLAIIDATVTDRDGRTLLNAIPEHPSLQQVPLLVLSLKPVSAPSLPPDCTGDQLLQMVRSILSRDKSQTDKEPVTEGPVDKKPTDMEPVEKVQVAQGSAGDPRVQQQLGELRTLSALGRSIAATLDLSTVLNQVVEAATSLTGAEEGMLLLPDEANIALYIRAMKNIDAEGARNFRIRTEDPLVGSVFTSGKPILASDQGMMRMKTEYFVKSLLYVPLTSKGKVIGVLGVNNRRESRIFSSHDLDLLLDLAAYAAIAIENAHLYEHSQQQNRQLTTLVKAGRAVNSTLALDEVLRTISYHLIDALDVHACLISQKDSTTSDLHLLAGNWSAVWRPGQGPQVSLDSRPLLKQAISQIAFYTVSDAQIGAQWTTERALLAQEGATQMIMLPIRSGNSAIGIAELYYQGPLPEVTDDFRAQVRSVALEIFTILSRVTETVPQTTLLALAQRILDSTQAGWLVLSQVHESTVQAVIRIGACMFLGELQPSEAPFPANMELFSAMQPLTFRRGKTSPPDKVKAALDRYGAAGMLCLPLSIKGQVFVTVMYDTLSVRRFTPDEVSLALALISGAASAIENARLYRDLERSLTQLRQAQSNLVQATRLS
ncbi:MAG TPA: GAF domain-containing protein, partial [Aggregatilineales bacterium]|nr:GAF domain-containing protein [Aggregatilineales bacterium]